jgi:hypothetical protein
MWSMADRFVKTVSDLTVGTLIVLVHVALADRTVRTARTGGKSPVATHASRS